MKVVQVVASVSEEAAGPSYSVVRLCESLSGHGSKVVLATVGTPFRSNSGGYLHEQYEQDFSALPGLNRLCLSSAMRTALMSRAEESDILHNHGVWLMPNIYSGWAAAHGMRPLVVSPRGMFGCDALAFSKWKKRAFWSLLQRSIVQKAACIHATSRSEYAEVRGLGLRNPVAIIPNGVDFTPIQNLQGDRPDRLTILYLGRLHPIKGIDRLLHAWSVIESSYSRWNLRIVGKPEGGHDLDLQALVRTLKLTRVSIEAPLYGVEKIKAYRDAQIFVLSTLNENFGLTVAESLAAGVPVISTKGAPWEGLVEHGCGWWIDHGVPPLVVALRTAMELPQSERQAMGARGAAWMKRDFAWEGVAQKMLEVYSWLQGRTERPAYVLID